MKYWCRSCNNTMDDLEYGCYRCDEDGNNYYCLNCESCNITTQLEEGAPVQLRAGGPAMTIQKIQNNIASCIWFDKNQEIKEASFSLSTLIFADFASNNEDEYDDDEEDEYYYDDY